MPIPRDIPTVITRARFRALIDPLLDDLGLNATDVQSCRFDSAGFTIVVFENDDDGRRLIAFDGVAKQTVRVHIEREAVA